SDLIRRLASNRARALLSDSGVVPSREAISFLRSGSRTRQAVAEEVSKGCSSRKSANRTSRLSEVNARARSVWARRSLRVCNIRIVLNERKEFIVAKNAQLRLRHGGRFINGGVTGKKRVLAESLAGFYHAQ